MTQDETVRAGSWSNLLAAASLAIDAMRVTQRLFNLPDGHVLMTACRNLDKAVEIIELENEKAQSP